MLNCGVSLRQRFREIFVNGLPFSHSTLISQDTARLRSSTGCVVFHLSRYTVTARFSGLFRLSVSWRLLFHI